MPPEVFRALTHRSDLKGWKQAGGHLVLFAATGSFVWLFWAQEQWAAFALALFLHGTVGSFFSGTATHELGYGTVFRTNALKRFFCIFLPLELVESV